jgi:uncharacterized protein with HEPN domain
VSRDENWKIRLFHMQDAIEKILEYCLKLKGSNELQQDSRTFDACIRNFQVLGDAAKKIPATIQREHPEIPWKKIKGMRNIIVHEYFGTSPSIVWKTIERDLPKLRSALVDLNGAFQKPHHPWKICSSGETYVHEAVVHEHLRAGHDVREHLRNEHCRINQKSSKIILTPEEVRVIGNLYFSNLRTSLSSFDLGFRGKGNKYDKLIAGWVQYWNEVLNPSEPLNPNIVKALIATESGFNPEANKGKRGAAKGLMQLLPRTIGYLNGTKGEIKDHIFEFSNHDVFDPDLNIAAGVRWLFRKRETASARLKRAATWTEAVAEYKDYLRRKSPSPQMEKFKGFYDALKKEGND